MYPRIKRNHGELHTWTELFLLFKEMHLVNQTFILLFGYLEEYYKSKIPVEKLTSQAPGTKAE